jgi:hypothetical protein
MTKAKTPSPNLAKRSVSPGIDGGIGLDGDVEAYQVIRPHGV